MSVKLELLRKKRCFLEKFTQLAQILHDRRLWRSRQISTLCESISQENHQNMFWGWNFRASLECIWCYQMSWIDRLWHSQNFTWERLLSVKKSQGNWNACFEKFGWQALACFRDQTVSGKVLDVTTCLGNCCMAGLRWWVFLCSKIEASLENCWM